MMQSNKSKRRPKHKSTKEFKFEAIGTLWSIEIVSIVSDAKYNKLISRTLGRIDQFDKNYSRFRGDSLVSKMSINPGIYELPEDAKPMLDLYRKLYEITDGKVTPLIGQTLSDAGYDSDYSFVSKKLKPVLNWEEVFSYDDKNIYIKQPALLDFGAAGKGYLVDIIGDLLKHEGILNFIINAGGDILHSSLKSDEVLIGLEHPDNNKEAVGIARINNQALCGSSISLRKWGEYNHIIDPEELKSPNHIRAVWVVADNAITADGLTTALMFVKPDKLKQYFDFSYAIIKYDFSLLYSSNFRAEFF